MPRDNKLYSGFVNHDYILTFSIADEANRARLVALCAGPWQGDEVTPGTWEVSNTLSPDQMERAILDQMGDADRAAYYYLSDSKRMFRVLLG
ncbi:hypothetical protein WME75_40940 [Sorangium sp. So ce1014]|uniref:hypothetical protein n=1 Tax=Sorangium sp. So ce1014 TaxID=3133326 RepID=UPI003F62EDF2